MATKSTKDTKTFWFLVLPFDAFVFFVDFVAIVVRRRLVTVNEGDA